MPRRLFFLLTAVALLDACGLRRAVAADLLFVRTNSGAYTSEEQARVTQLESWGYTVTPIWDGDSQANFDAAVAAADVAFAGSTVDDHELLYKLRTAGCGVVSETHGLDEEFGYVSAEGYNVSASTIESVDNSHTVTAGLAPGTVTIVSSAQELSANNGTIATGMTVLANQNYGLSLGVLEAGGALANTHNSNSTASGRRVRMPWGYTFSWSSLNADGLLILQNALSWASAGDDTDLLLHWKLDETCGATATDSSPYTRDGTVSGTTAWTAAPRKNGLSTGAGGRVAVTDELGEPASWTVAGWADTTGTEADGAAVVSVGDCVALLSHYSGSGSPAVAYWNGSALQYVTASGGSQVGAGWRHYAATFDNATKSLRIYIDGELAGSGTTSGSPVYDVGTRTVAGDVDTTYYAMQLTGALDDIRVYNRPLSDAEVAELFGFMGHWRLDEESGATAYDSSPSGNDGDYLNAPYLGSQGARTNSVTLAADTGHDRVRIPHGAIDGQTEATVAWWMRTSKTGEQAVLSGANATFSQANSFLLFFSNHKTFTPYLDGTNKSLGINSIADDRWRHFVFTHDRASGAAELFINGQSAGTLSYPARTGTFSVSANGLILGEEQDSVGGGFVESQALVGDLDDVRIYNRILSQEEIAALYGLIGHWRLDEASGTTAADSSGAGNDGTYNGGPALAAAGPYPGDGANSAELDGAGDYVDLPDLAVDFQDGCTLSCWARPTSNGVWERFVDLGNGAGGDNLLFGRRSTSNDLTVHLYGGSLGGSQIITATDGLTNDQWRHYVAVVDHQGQATLYRDGVELTTATIGVPSSEQRADNFIGRSNWGADANFQGRLHDVRLYNRPLSLSEIGELYGLVGQWKLDESSGSVAVDSSLMQQHGTYAGGVALGGAGPVSNLQAASFDGVDGHVQLPSYSTDFSRGVTLMAWGKPSAAPYWARFLELSNGEDVDNLVLARDETTSTLAATNHDGSLSAVERMYAADAITNSTWQHYAFTLDSTGLGTLYVNGESVATDVMGTPSDAVRATNYIARSSYGVDGYYQGQTYDARVYNRPATAEEIEAAYQSGRVQGLRIIRWVESR
ncbi:Pentaxin family protein [Posidoniimonas corsicana]|uniref:Pentaxin family protein n=1 Tax=Posidoniimonas corsicana TaxID=1938618 RepID=A0A5C5UVJ0_9BACT|nr:LamG domain-containing protein [Posidoniimonas corsicana]TWT30168.1 Pentaxin family protein [Posidoniimonas corsicana]